MYCGFCVSLIINLFDDQFWLALKAAKEIIRIAHIFKEFKMLDGVASGNALEAVILVFNGNISPNDVCPLLTLFFHV